MKKYTKRIIDYLKQSQEIKVSGIEGEVAKHFNPDVRSFRSTDEEPVVIECFGITNPNPNYKVEREKSHNYVLEYVVSGTGHIEIEDEKFDVKANDVYLLYPNTKQRYYSDSNDPFKKYWVNFQGDDIDKILESLKIKGIHHFPNCNLTGFFIQLFSAEEINCPSIEFSYFTYSKIISMLIEMKKSLNNKKQDSSLANQIKALIDSNATESIKINDICNELGISKTYAINCFKDKYGVTPNQYRINQKMNIARDLLINKDVSIKNIALSLNFIDQYHFSNSFKKHFGMYPSEYRKIYLNK